ncbi:tRNA(Ile)-lysidine synthase [Quadrisphaera granulorum]|uniref:tRNA(Ile)-lysidine synthase n=1 Tax=Quadrisphaera granulorum TaxID=317664 RepID=A0A316A7V2_9ACTN|nr:tRNA lysidine(34) synthetase TilS [Quadrisphaera granulorum]PWJ53308.1 tRNA(Ile)-lysidine synthase [Quadrisphaera granulorum]SZE96982.1 tRNA(Ile)-lysidine synthase [Quadrisphaera granulorum]
MTARGPDPAVATVRSAVRAACADVPAGALVLVACSGGADSLALAAAAGWLAGPGGPGRARWRAGAVVVDHGLQPGSAAIAEEAAARCRALGLDPVDVVTVQVGRSTDGPEAAARDARLAALDAAARRSGAAAVLLGHTLDDQAEQVLLGLARGSGARSLAGMPRTRGVLRRPLLEVTRTTTRAACAALGLRPWDDPTNADPAYSRSRVRSRVLPVLEDELGPGVAAALARTADQLREDAEVLEQLAAELLARAVLTAADDAQRELDIAVLAAAPAALRRRALRAAAVHAGAAAGELSRFHVLAVDALVVAWRGQGAVQLPGLVEVRRTCGRLRLAPAAPQRSAPGGD